VKPYFKKERRKEGREEGKRRDKIFSLKLILLHPFFISSPSHWFQLPGRRTFLFVEDSYTECFIVTFPCIYVLSPELE
jgi:hypothetical protein